MFTVKKHLEKETLEAHILRNVPESDCEIINLTENPENFYWEKQDEIFYLDGVMYDVTRKKIIDGNVYLYCIKETKEMELLDDLSLKISGESEGNKAYCFIETDEYTTTCKVNVNILLPLVPSSFSRYINETVTQVKNIHIPPPRPAC